MIYSKFCRPTKISRQILFSNNACVSTKMRYFRERRICEEGHSNTYGEYVANKDSVPVLQFRIINIRPVFLVSPSVELLLVRRFGCATNGESSEVLHLIQIVSLPLSLS
jgi:hypothetical protein